MVAETAAAGALTAWRNADDCGLWSRQRREHRFHGQADMHRLNERNQLSLLVGFLIQNFVRWIG
jgi:hypothetical protein